MSLRHKLAAWGVVLLIANVFILLAWFHLFIDGPVSQEYADAQSQLDTLVQEIAQQCSEKNTADSLWTFLETKSEEKNITIRIENAVGETVYESTTDENYIRRLWLNSSAIFEHSGEYYMLCVSRHFTTSSLFVRTQGESLIWVEIWIIFVICLMAGGLVYFFYIRPIEDLEEQMTDYRRGKRPEPTERRDEVGKLQNTFCQLIDELESEKNKQSRIIASISHDIKTPLTSVMGYAERMRNGTLSSERTARYVETIYQKSLVIRDLVDQFDDYISLNMHTQHHPALLSSDELISLVRSEYEDELSSEGISLRCEAQCPARRVNVDISQLRRVFGNIIGNSIKHMSRKERRIVMTVSEGADNCMLISIADNGTGVPEDKLGQIFEPLYTSDAGRTVAGLGLAICREAIEAHGGRIWAENNVIGGLTIAFTLPIAEEK